MTPQRPTSGAILVAAVALSTTALLTAACSQEASTQPPPAAAGAPATTAVATTDAGAGTTTGDDGGETTGPYEGALVPVIVATYPHDTSSFTQGLEWYGDALLESTGLEGESTLRLVDPETGQSSHQLDISDDLFAEGVTVVDDRALQLTFQDETLLVTDLADLTDGAAQPPSTPSRRDDAYEGEGWGLCYDGTRLVMSDGSEKLTFRDPGTFEAIGQVAVTLNGEPLAELNELECVAGQVWANIWKSTMIVAIDPATGEIDATVDASGLVPDGYDGDDRAVLNGIAYHHDQGTFWLTGKLWPVVHEVELAPATELSEPGT